MEDRTKTYFIPLTSLLTVLFFLGATGLIHAQEITRDGEDDFRGERIVETSREQIEHEGFPGSSRVTFLYAYRSYLLALIVTSSAGWQIYGDDTAEFIVDENRRTYNIELLSTDRNQGVTSGHYGISLEEGEVRELGSAEDVRFRINGNVYTLTDEAKEAAQLIVDRVAGTE